MTIVYDMAAGRIRSEARQEHRNEAQQEKCPEILPYCPATALREFEPAPQAEPVNIHLLRALLPKG
jgi:hypothetical protein